MYSPEKPPRDPCHLFEAAAGDPYRAGGIAEDFDNEENGPTLLLQAAARLGDLDRMSIAIDNGASMSAKDSWGLAPLHMNALIGCTAGVDLLVRSRAMIDELSLRGQSALHLAVAEGKDDISLQLLSLKADVGLSTSFGSTVLAIAERRRRAQTLAQEEPSPALGRVEEAIRAELSRRLEFAEAEESDKKKQYADAIATREGLEAQLGAMAAEIRAAMDVDDQPDEEKTEASADVLQLEEELLDSTEPQEQPEKPPELKGSKTMPLGSSADETPQDIARARSAPMPGSLTEVAAEEPTCATTPVANGYEYWRTTRNALEGARTKGEEALKRSWIRELPSASDRDAFPWTGELKTTDCLPTPDPDDDMLVHGYEWLEEVAREEEARMNSLKQQALLADGGESLVQKTRDEAMMARTGATQLQWETRVQELKENNCPWDWSHIEVRQRTVSSECFGSAGVFAVGSSGKVVFEEHDVIGPLGGVVRRRSRYEELYFSGHHWTLHDTMSFQMSLNAQTADLKTERLVIDLRAGKAQNRLRYLSDVRSDPMGLRERLGIGEPPTTKSILPTRRRMPRPKSRPGSPETEHRGRQAAASPSTTQAAPSGDRRTANATWAEVNLDGWPYVFVVATQKIRADEEIAIDYGEDYWVAQRELFSHFLDMGKLGDETVVRVNGVERDAEAYKESLSGQKEHWEWQRDRLAKEWK